LAAAGAPELLAALLAYFVCDSLNDGQRTVLKDPHKMSRRCDTCIYRRSMRELLGESVPTLIREARESGGFVICHESLPAWHGEGAGIPPSICHGYATENPDTFALRVARALGRIQPIDPTPAAHGRADDETEC
jgi:hypothetical protein